MLSRRLLASFVVFLWYTTPSLAQLPKQCPPDVLLVKDIGELWASEAKVYVHVIQVKFDPDSQIPVDIQEEIAKNETGKTHEVKADSDYLQNVAKEIADEGAGELLRSHGYLQALTYAELEVLKTKGVDVDVAANVGAEPERQYRLGEIVFKRADRGEALFYGPDTLRKKIPLKHGEIINAEKIREGLRNLTSMYGEEGYIDFTAEPEFDFDNAGNTIDMVILIRPDKQYRIREIEFWGLDSLVEKRLRESYQQSGEAFSKLRLEQFVQEVQEVLRSDAKPDEIVTIRRDAEAGLIGIVFDLRPCPGQQN